MVLDSCTLLGEGILSGSFGLGGGGVCAAGSITEEEEGCWPIDAERGMEEHCASSSGNHCGCGYSYCGVEVRVKDVSDQKR